MEDNLKKLIFSKTGLCIFLFFTLLGIISRSVINIKQNNLNKYLINICKENWYKVKVDIDEEDSYILSDKRMGLLKKSMKELKSFSFNHDIGVKRGDIIIKTGKKEYYLSFVIINRHLNDIIIKSKGRAYQCKVQNGAEILGLKYKKSGRF